MENISLTYLLLIILVTFSFGFLLGHFIAKLKFKNNANLAIERNKATLDLLHKSQSKEEKSINKLEEIQQEKEFLGKQLVKAEVDLENLQDIHFIELKNATALQDKFTKEFELLATKILEEKSNKFTLQNKENIQNILNPLQDKITHFENKVIQSQKENIGLHAALKEQLSQLQNQNIKISKEAQNLTNALKGDNKIQGNWGELVLERVLEKSGLEKGREYIVQKSFTKEDGSRQLPDVIISLPGNKKMIIDSKVSLTAYEQYVNASLEEQESLLKKHLLSLKRHINQLSDKKYEDLYVIDSPDFVLLFIPIEPAFAVALNADPQLYNNAFEKNIVIVTPTTLLATLRTIDTMWNNEKQQQNAIEIAKQAGALYDKFLGFVVDLTTVGRKMDDAKIAYDGAMNKLNNGQGNLLTKIEKLKKMGAKTKKSLPENLLRQAKESE